eukprot:jgi/Psemu1/53378/gm1.53378_g
MPATEFDWNNIRDIAIQFGTFNAKDNAHKHEDLNKTFAHNLEYTDGLFITDNDAEGPKTLAPDLVTMLREIIRLRNKHSMDKAGELSIENGQDTIFIEIRATHWGFKPDWDAIHFAEVYDTNIYTDKIPNASRAHFANLPQRKYIKPKAVPLQRKPIQPQVVPPNTAILTVPSKPIKSEAHTAIQVPSSYVTSSSATTDLLTNKMIHSDVVATPSNTTIASVPPVTANSGPLQPVGSIADTPLPYANRSFANTYLNNPNTVNQPVACQVAISPTINAPTPDDALHYTWTWTYSPHSESVSFCRVRSNSFLRATSSSPPVQRQEKSSIVTAPPVSPSAQTRIGHHPVPPYVPANFGWTFNPQNEIATFQRLPKSVTSPQPLLRTPLLPSEALAEGTDLPTSLSYNSPNDIGMP